MTSPDRRSRKIRNNTLAGIASLLIAIVYVATLGLNPDQKAAVTYQTQDNIADRVAIQLEISRFNENGELSHTLLASRAEYYQAYKRENLDLQPLAKASNQDTEFDMEHEFEHGLMPDTASQNNTQKNNHGEELIQLQNPLINIIQSDNSKVQVTAQTGYLLAQRNNIKLAGDVRLTDDSNESFLFSQTLTIDTLQKQVFTYDNVKLLHPQSSTIATGLQGNIAQQHWQLLGDVQSTFYAE